MIIFDIIDCIYNNLPEVIIAAYGIFKPGTGKDSGKLGFKKIIGGSGVNITTGTGSIYIENNNSNPPLGVKKYAIAVGKGTPGITGSIVCIANKSGNYNYGIYCARVFSKISAGVPGNSMYNYTDTETMILGGCRNNSFSRRGIIIGGCCNENSGNCSFSGVVRGYNAIIGSKCGCTSFNTMYSSIIGSQCSCVYNTESVVILGGNVCVKTLNSIDVCGFNTMINHHLSNNSTYNLFCNTSYQTSISSSFDGSACNYLPYNYALSSVYENNTFISSNICSIGYTGKTSVISSSKACLAGAYSDYTKHSSIISSYCNSYIKRQNNFISSDKGSQLKGCFSSLLSNAESILNASSYSSIISSCRMSIDSSYLSTGISVLNGNTCGIGGSCQSTIISSRKSKICDSCNSTILSSLESNICSSINSVLISGSPSNISNSQFSFLVGNCHQINGAKDSVIIGYKGGNINTFGASSSMGNVILSGFGFPLLPDCSEIVGGCCSYGVVSYNSIIGGNQNRICLFNPPPGSPTPFVAGDVSISRNNSIHGLKNFIIAGTTSERSECAFAVSNGIFLGSYNSIRGDIKNDTITGSFSGVSGNVIFGSENSCIHGGRNNVIIGGMCACICNRSISKQAWCNSAIIGATGSLDYFGQCIDNNIFALTNKNITKVNLLRHNSWTFVGTNKVQAVCTTIPTSTVVTQITVCNGVITSILVS